MPVWIIVLLVGGAIVLWPTIKQATSGGTTTKTGGGGDTGGTDWASILAKLIGSGGDALAKTGAGNKTTSVDDPTGTVGEEGGEGDYPVHEMTHGEGTNGEDGATSDWGTQAGAGDEYGG